MGVKNILNPVFISAASLGSDYASTALSLIRAREHHIQLVLTGAPVGSFKLQISADSASTPGAVVNWDDMPDSTQAISAAGSLSWKVTGRYKWVRVVYTRTSGTGAVDGTLFAIEEY